MEDAPSINAGENATVPLRLIVCVDGTWSGPDGVYPRGNISNVFRIWCCVKEGEVTGANGRRWRQERVYIKGLDDSASWFGKLLAGAFGTGVEQQIKKVYQLCCERASHPDDEVFFFGFSRGAFVVRAVANLLAYMRRPGAWANQQAFDEAYENMLSIYKDVRSGNKQKAGAIYEYMSSCRPAPRVQFIGVIDTVKAFDDEGLYELGIHSAHRHCRHALALNETDGAFTPQLWNVRQGTAEFELRKASKLHSILEAWFLGTHGDLGGAKADDGLAMYAAQWLLSEAQDVGLVLGFCEVTYSTSISRSQQAIANQVELLFPGMEDLLPFDKAEIVTVKNGIGVRMWDMSNTHEQKGLSISVRDRVDHWLESTSRREVFSDDKLKGYCPDAPLGTFVHPSVYVIIESGRYVDIVRPAEEPWRTLLAFRRQCFPADLPALQGPVSVITPNTDTRFRLLVCGNAGVGKSTLINLLLGAPVTQTSAGAHGVHDVETGFSPEGAKYIVHDSCGFQAGQEEDVAKIKNFLQSRSCSPDFAERVHAVLYCISSTRLRTTETADGELLRAVKDCDVNIPVTVVATRIDEVEALCGDKVERAFMSEHGKSSRRQLTPSDWDSIEEKTSVAVDAKKEEVARGMNDLGHSFSGPVFTSKGNPDSISELTDIIMQSLTDERVRNMFIAAQICSIQPKIDWAIDNSIRLYGHAVRTAALPIAFSGLIASTTITALIVKDVLKAFQFSGNSSDIAVRTISTMLVGNYESNGLYVATNVISAAAAGSMATGIGALPGVALGAGSYVLKLSAVPQFGRMLLMCTVDTVLIMETMFWQCGGQVASEEHLRAACEAYKARMEKVHAEIKEVLPLWGVWDAFRFGRLRTELRRIVETHRVPRP